MGGGGGDVAGGPALDQEQLHDAPWPVTQSHDAQWPLVQVIEQVLPPPQVVLQPVRQPEPSSGAGGGWFCGSCVAALKLRGPTPSRLPFLTSASETRRRMPA